MMQSSPLDTSRRRFLQKLVQSQSVCLTPYTHALLEVHRKRLPLDDAYLLLLCARALVCLALDLSTAETTCTHTMPSLLHHLPCFM